SVPVIVCMCAFSFARLAHAEDLADPTRPPAALGQVGDGDASASAAGRPVLQSVMISPGRTMAMISGRMVRVGDKVGEARVTKISETEVVLRNGKELETLKLFPGVEKRRNSSRSKTDGRQQ
ncbi:MAG: biosis protein MshK, partial [Burkholderiales bacterium]